MKLGDQASYVIVYLTVLLLILCLHFRPFCVSYPKLQPKMAAVRRGDFVFVCFNPQEAKAADRKQQRDETLCLKDVLIDFISVFFTTQCQMLPNLRFIFNKKRKGFGMITMGIVIYNTNVKGAFNKTSQITPNKNCHDGHNLSMSV